MCLCRFLVLFAGVTALFGAPARADMNDPLANRLTPTLVAEFFAEADGISAVEGDPPIATVTRTGEAVGYLFSTHETAHPVGYSGQSFDIVVALGVDGVIRGHRTLEHHEPLIGPGTSQISLENVNRFLSQLHALDLKIMRRPRAKSVDGISGATVSAHAMRGAMMVSAVTVGYLKGVISDNSGGLSLDRYNFTQHTWSELVADATIRTLPLTNGSVRKEFSAAGMPEPDIGPDDELFLTLYTALATPKSIGRNLFGSNAFRQISQSVVPGEHQLMIASSGDYRWLPRNPWLVEMFDRVRVVQNGTVISLRPENFYPARRYAIDGAPTLQQGGRFRIPAGSGCDPIQEWSVELSVFAAEHHEEMVAAVNFFLPYRVPQHYVIGDDIELEDAGFKEPHYVGIGRWRDSTLTDWQRTWIDKQWPIMGLLALLVAITTVMLFQHSLAHSRRLYSIVRIGLLAVTLVWLGWIAGAQLTILSVINYVTLAANSADWHVVLFDPLLVILTGYVLVTLVLWGRGLFCGWLCPFGALQELLAKLSALVRLPRLSVQPSLQKRAWMIKYAIGAGIIGLAIYATNWAPLAAEVEPFKTAISLRFDRSWQYVLYAAALLVCGLFIERFYCRYLCPLGAVLALIGRFHLLDRLRRRPECGNPCHLCEQSCPIGAITPTGAIEMNECLQCLDCQLEYYDERRCPPLVAELKLRERLSVPAPGIGSAELT